jgi:hypothetical protein
MLCLPLHTTYILKPLAGTVYKPKNASYFHQHDTAYMYDHPQAHINESNFGSVYSVSWYKIATFGNVLSTASDNPGSLSWDILAKSN